ncbi:hypothetical protein OAK91_00190 [Planctomycetaceae bacterium]|nr:hypothetical protein [bacterium]MDB4680064.1 hypothetical protein [Planctomycetaceae bacterium]MDB4786982.1 hypothetical protein [Planctomycetaceae bacterium]MDC0273133.1 hypothetical protein [Planctomycetaceae bacterium]
MIKLSEIGYNWLSREMTLADQLYINKKLYLNKKRPVEAGP